MGVVTSSKRFVGDIFFNIALTAPTGSYLCDGSTIGSAGSGSDEADDANELLFNIIWTLDDTLWPILTSVGGGSSRGASAAADWAADKRITLCDLRGRSIVGPDNMGGSSANVLTDAAADTVGGVLGDENETPTIAKTAAHTHTLQTSKVDNSGSGYYSADGAFKAQESTNSTGSGTSLDIVQPVIAINTYIQYL